MRGREVIYHGTPVTPNAAFDAIMPGRAACVSFFRPDQINRASALCPKLMLDNGAYSFWQEAMRAGKEFAPDRDWRDFYDWVGPRLVGETWAVIPDRPGAPSQLNDALLNDWPFGVERAAPLWHMDGPISRLLRLAEKYPRVCLGWIGEIDPATNKVRKDQRAVGCAAYRHRMDEVAAALGNQWPNLHMMRGTAVFRDYPFTSADSSSIAKNGWRYDSRIYDIIGDPWAGRIAYADRLERGDFSRSVRRRLLLDHSHDDRRTRAHSVRSAEQSDTGQLGLF